MNNKFELLASSHWGTGNNEISKELVNYSAFSLAPPGQVRKKYAPLRFKLDPKRGFHVLNNQLRDILDNDDIYITHFIPGGNFGGKTPVLKNQPGFEKRRIVDFAVDELMNCFLLETYRIGKSSYNRLIRLDKNGKIVWEIRGPFIKEACDFYELKGSFNKLLTDSQSNLYLTSDSQIDTIAKINPVNGNVLEVYTLGHGGDNTFVNEAGTILKVVYFEKQNRRGVSILKPSSFEEKFTVFNAELFGLLLFPFGVDNRLNSYVCKVPNVYEEPAIVRISFDGKVIHHENFKDLLVRSNDNTIFTCYGNNEEIVISGYFQNGSTQKWHVRFPAHYSIDKDSNYKLIEVDESNKFHILVNAEKGNAATLLVFSAKGEFNEEIRQPKNLSVVESFLQPYSYWQVDGDGNIYFPLAAPDGFKIIRMNFCEQKG